MWIKFYFNLSKIWNIIIHSKEFHSYLLKYKQLFKNILKIRKKEKWLITIIYREISSRLMTVLISIKIRATPNLLSNQVWSPGTPVMRSENRTIQTSWQIMTIIEIEQIMISKDQELQITSNTRHLEIKWDLNKTCTNNHFKLNQPLKLQHL